MDRCFWCAHSAFVLHCQLRNCIRVYGGVPSLEARQIRSYSHQNKSPKEHFRKRYTLPTDARIYMATISKTFPSRALLSWPIEHLALSISPFIPSRNPNLGNQKEETDRIKNDQQRGRKKRVSWRSRNVGNALQELPRQLYCSISGDKK